MANTLLTSAIILKESLRVLHNNCVFLRAANKQYSPEFARTGAKVGATINVRKPNQYFVRKGIQMQSQNTVETSVPVTLDNIWGVDLNFNDVDLALSIDDFSERYITPAMARLAAQIDLDGLAQYANVYNWVGTPGITPGTSGTSGGSVTGLYQYNSAIAFINAGMVLSNMACPDDGNRRCVINPATQGMLLQAGSTLFNPSAEISDQYRKGVMSKNFYGFELAVDQNINTFTCGTRVATGVTTVQATNAGTGETTIAVTGGSTTIAAGDIFSVTGVYQVNPENQQSTGILQPFVVTQAVTLSGTTTLNVQPPIVLAGTGIANGTVNRVPTASDTVVFIGENSTVTPQMLAYHKDAFTFATADLQLPSGVEFAARDTYEGISMRIVRDYIISDSSNPCRIDILGGWKTLRPELACRIFG